MKISDLERVLAEVKHSHGDVEILCGDRPIGAVAILGRKYKTAVIILRERRHAPRPPP